MSHKVVTFGEIMLRLGAPDNLRLTQCNKLELSFAGSEANVAVSLANYGIPVDYVTRLPDNPISEKCLMELRSHKVNVDNVLIGGSRIGILYLETGAVARSSRVFYDRANSALATIKRGELKWESIFEGATWFHWTGITTALSKSATDVCLEAILAAKRMGLTISCDINYRKNLWLYGETASDVMPNMIKYCDIILGNEEDFDKVFGIKPLGFNVNETKNGVNQALFESVCQQMMKRFPVCKKIAVTLRGSINANHNIWSGVLYDGKHLFVSKEYDITHIVDRVGGGDSFMGGLIYGLIQYKNNSQKALEFAVASSCLKHTIKGDFNLVSIEEVESLIKGNESGRVKR